MRVAGAMAVILVVVWVVGQAMGLLSMPSDVGVVVGLVILLSCIGGGVSAIMWGARKIKRSLDRKKRKR